MHNHLSPCDCCNLGCAVRAPVIDNYYPVGVPPGEQDSAPYGYLFIISRKNNGYFPAIYLPFSGNLMWRKREKNIPCSQLYTRFNLPLLMNEHVI
jgi:hypothetical protein